MTTSANDAHDYPIYGARYRVIVPILDADGDLVTGAAGLDSEVSKDSGTFADCTNEATEIATSSGMYYLDLTATEMSAKSVSGVVKTSTSGAKTTPFALNPVRLPVVRTGTAQAGPSTTITLDSSASTIDDVYCGCFVNITNNTPSNVLGQARKITAYNGTTKVATVEAAWGTNPSSSSTFEILATAERPYLTDVGDVRGKVLGGGSGTITGTGVRADNRDGDAIPTAAQILAAGDIDGYAIEAALKLVLAACAGKSSGAGTGTEAIRAADDSKARITATVDSDGNRLAVTLDSTG